jgi:hypothetical protein
MGWGSCRYCNRLHNSSNGLSFLESRYRSVQNLRVSRPKGVGCWPWSKRDSASISEFKSSMLWKEAQSVVSSLLVGRLIYADFWIKQRCVRFLCFNLGVLSSIYRFFPVKKWRGKTNLKLNSSASVVMSFGTGRIKIKHIINLHFVPLELH